MREADAARQRERRADRKARGVCLWCGGPRCPESRALCAAHHRANKENGAGRRRRQKEAGRCKYCPAPVAPGSATFCPAHLERERDRRRAGVA